MLLHHFSMNFVHLFDEQLQTIGKEYFPRIYQSISFFLKRSLSILLFSKGEENQMAYIE